MATSRSRGLAGTTEGAALCVCRDTRLRHIGGRGACSGIKYVTVTTDGVSTTLPKPCRCPRFVPLTEGII